MSLIRAVKLRLIKQQLCMRTVKDYPRGGGGDSHMKKTGMLVGNFEFNP